MLNKSHNISLSLGLCPNRPLKQTTFSGQCPHRPLKQTVFYGRSPHRSSINFLNIFLIVLISFLGAGQVFSQTTKTLIYDTDHKNYDVSEAYPDLLPDSISAVIQRSEQGITDSLLNGKFGLLLFFPQIGLADVEKQSVLRFLKKGGSLFLVFDEGKRTPFNGINDLIAPFGIELTEHDLPYVHNCGAIAEAGDVCKERREIPYSGGRAVIGGRIISKVYMEGDHVHSAYVNTSAGGKIIVMADGMAALLMGSAKGERLTGKVPSDTKYWGKDSTVFMQELLAFFLSE